MPPSPPSPESREAPPLETSHELLHAIEARLIDKTGRLLKPRATFVRFCAEHHYFGGHLLNDWRPIDGLLTDSKGRPVTAEKLAQSYQDIMTKSVQ